MTPKGIKNTDPLNKVEEVKAEEIIAPEVKAPEIKPDTKEPVAVYEKDDGYNLNIIKDYYGKIDVFYLSKKDPNFEYRFLRADFKNISVKTGNVLFQKGGWQIVPGEHLLKIGFKREDLAADGSYRVGDTILARMPKDLFKEKEAYKQKLADRPVTAIQRMLDKGDPNVGGEEMHKSMEGIQPQKKLGM